MTASKSNGRGRNAVAGRARAESQPASNELGRLRESSGLARLPIPRTSARASIAERIRLETVAQSWRENELLAGLRHQTPRGWGLRYGLAVGAVAAAWGSRSALAAWVGPALAPFITFYPATMLVALLAGLGPGLVATAMTFAIVAFEVLPQVGQLAISSPADRLGLAVFTCMGLVISLVAEFYRRDRDKAAAYDREAALREGRKRLAAFAEATFEGIVESEGGRVVDCNEQFAQMTGYAAAELMGMEIAHLVPPEDRDRVAANIQQNRDSVIEHAVLRKDGARIVVEAHGRPSSPGSATRHTVIRDITERKRAEEALAESEERSRNIVQYAPAAIYEMSVDGERFISVNDAMCQMLGYSREELLELRPRDLLDDESRAVFLDRVRRKLAGAEIDDSLEYRARTKDRRWIDGIINTGSLTCKDGRPDSVLVIAHDITARKRLERMYAVLSRVNETIVRTDDEQVLCQDVCRIVVEDGGFPLVWIGTVTGREVRPVASSGAAVGYLGEIRVEVDGPLGSGPTGTSIRENRSVINDDFDTNPTTKPWRQSALGHGFRASAAFPLHRAGKTVGALTLYAARPGAFDSEQVKLLEALSADVSYALEAMDQERRRAEAEQALRESEQSLREIDRGKDEFLAMVSHELRNPLSPIANSLFILDRAVPGGEQANRAKAVIGRQVGQLTRLVDDLLDVTRITRGKFRLQRARFDLIQMARRTADDHRPIFVDAGVTFDVRTDTRPLWVDGDEARMAQVVGNLLTNSAKFTANGGTVALELEAEAPGGMAVLRVRDTGAGISSSMLPKLFEPFIQADESLDRSKGGLGLGLALVRGIVEMHGGVVEAHSEGPGTGAEFVIRLPAELGEAARVPPSRPPSHPPSRRVLVIEDNEDAADSLRDVLEFGAHQVEVAHSGPAGLRKAREFQPEVVICDIGLPGMSGYEVARALRGDEVLRTAHLVALTGYALPDDQRRAREAGFEHHLPKPTSIEKIEELFANLSSSEAE